MEQAKNQIAASETQVYQNIRTVLVTARQKVYSVINSAMVEAYWEIGRQIEQAVGDRAEYGKELLKSLSIRLTEEFGKGFDETNLRKMRQFFQVFQIRDALRLELSWTHYRLLMKIDNEPRREFYLKECADSNWSSRQLERQITSFYYERLLATPKKGVEPKSGPEHSAEPHSGVEPELCGFPPNYILKDPYILEFLDLNENKKYHENELEQALIDNLQKFLMELGKGFSFVARQKRITIEGDHYYVDLVFYNYMLKCFVVIDLKTGKLSYQDIGQIDFYVRYFDDQIKLPEDNPTLGIILCADKNETMAKYSVLSDKDNLLASKYMLCLPTEEELKKALKREHLHIESKPEEDGNSVK